VAVAATLFQEMADRENRTAEVGQHDHSLAAIRPGDGGSNDVAGGAQGAVRSATRRLDTDFSPGHLRGQGGEAVSQLIAVGDQYNPDQINHTPQRRPLIPDDLASLHYRQQFSNAES